jgi:hypothetical protein
MEHRAGRGAGDAVHGLDAGDHQPAQLIQTGRLDPGDDVVGTGDVFGHLHTIQVAERWATWATLPTSVWMGTYALSTVLTSSASDRAIALTWSMASRAVDDAQESPSC